MDSLAAGEGKRTVRSGRQIGVPTACMLQPVAERVKKLRDEIAEISKANREHLHRRKYSAPIAEQDRRLLRLQEILDELMSMTDWKKP
jgi:hypothetical protein